MFTFPSSGLLMESMRCLRQLSSAARVRYGLRPHGADHRGEARCSAVFIRKRAKIHTVELKGKSSGEVWEQRAGKNTPAEARGFDALPYSREGWIKRPGGGCRARCEVYDGTFSLH